MKFRTLLISSLLTTLATVAVAQSSGNSDEDAACRADVRRFCSKVTEAEGSNAFLQCLQEHRAKLSKRCLAVLEKHGV